MLERVDFKKGDIIIYCDDEFEVLENYGKSGKVKEVCGDVIIDNFYWNFRGSICELKTN